MRTAGLKISMASNSYTPTKSPFGILQRHVKIYPLLHVATRVATPTICNSDQGSHFTSPQYRNMLQAAEVQISMNGKGRALDNIFTERLWRTVKYEEVYIHDYLSPREARQALTRYFTFYNQERLHQALDYQTPAEVYFSPSMSEVH